MSVQTAPVIPGWYVHRLMYIEVQDLYRIWRRRTSHVHFTYRVSVTNALGESALVCIADLEASTATDHPHSYRATLVPSDAFEKEVMLSGSSRVYLIPKTVVGIDSIPVL